MEWPLLILIQLPNYKHYNDPDEPEFECQTIDYDPVHKLTVNPEIVYRVVIKAKRSVSAGPAGYKPLYFKQIIKSSLHSLYHY